MGSLASQPAALSIAAAPQAAQVRRDPDIPFVPTTHEAIQAMLKLADVKKTDIVYDLGCGDGRIVIAAAKNYGAHAVGIDINPVRIAEAKANAKTAGVEDLAQFREGDLFEADIHEASVLSLFLLPSVNMQLRPKLLQELNRGARVVSNTFDMRDWKAEKEAVVGGQSEGAWLNRRLFLWTIPPQFLHSNPAAEETLFEILAVLRESRLPYKVFGGLAVAAWGAARWTKDADLCVCCDRANFWGDVQSVVKHFRLLRWEPSPDGLNAWTTVAAPGLRSSADLFFEASNAGEFTAHTATRPIRGIPVRVVDLDWLIVSLALSGRPMDLADLCTLIQRHRRSLDVSGLVRGIERAAGRALHPDVISAILSGLRAGVLEAAGARRQFIPVRFTKRQRAGENRA